ncbi:MAG: aminotransferase class V-fold PLP-dependent enzyme [bacterium]|nr:aminotransferase class V-fold PLP-dependent enzyme [bacterium]
MNNYVKAMINRMSRATQTELTPRHEEILEYTYKYYQQNRVAPLLYNFKQHIGATKEEINRLFPHGLYSIFTWIGIPVQSADNLCKPMARMDVDDYRYVYLDHNATTYIRPEVAEILIHYCSGDIGFENPSSSTIQGKKAYDLVESTRETISHCLSVDPEEIFFTGSGSESNNFAVKGIAFKHLDTRGHIITSQIEHSSISKTMEFLETLGFSVSYIEVGSEGIVSPDSVKEAMREDTILVSIMAVNNEIGIINPIQEIGELCRDRKIPFMVDAVQGFGKIPLTPGEMGISMLSFSGHKIYAPKGVGGLYVDREIQFIPLIHGGAQEFGMRAGTENVGYVVAIGHAAELAHAEMESECERLTELRDFFLSELRKIEPNFLVNGSVDNRIPHNLSIAFPHVDSGALLLSLNSIGICVSAGSACSSGKIETSYVLEAIGADTENYGTVRFSFGLRTTKEDLDYLFKYLPSILEQIRE